MGGVLVNVLHVKFAGVPQGGLLQIKISAIVHVEGH